MALGPNQMLVVSLADAKKLRKEFEWVVAQWPKSRWLSASNKYSSNTTKQLDLDTSAGGTIAHIQLGRYIAASTIVHCVDGWSYVSRALEAALSGDIDAATHLAYYAELRAAMSVLAASGIGVFDKKNFVLTSNGNCRQVNGSTHEFVWNALSHWATLSAASDLLLEVVQPGGFSLDTWLQHFPGSAGSVARSRVVSKWLLDWGVDLRVFAEDRRARNQSSYRPTAIPHVKRLHFSDSLEFLEGFWTTFEPSALHPFRVLDRYLLRRSIAQAFKASSGSSPKRAPQAYMSFVRKVIHAVGPGDLSAAEWEQFLDLTSDKADSPLLAVAEGKATKDAPEYHLQIIARAGMLLRVATGASRALVGATSSAERAQLAFWWHAIGEDRGFWDSPAIPASLVDLWADVDNAVAQARVARSASQSRRTFLGSNPGAARMLSACERIPLWGLGI
jgi:hypothetical protein